jgi:hypothetical protein
MVTDLFTNVGDGRMRGTHATARARPNQIHNARCSWAGCFVEAHVVAPAPWKGGTDAAHHKHVEMLINGVDSEGTCRVG